MNKRTNKDLINDLEKGIQLPESESGYAHIWNAAANFEYPDTEEDWKDLKAKITQSHTSKKHIFLQVIYKQKAIAAAIALLLMAGIFFITPKYFTNQSTQLCYTTQGSETLEVQLTDGSKVTLNGNSKLVVESGFNKEHRNVTLQGEGFFSVSKSKNLSFSVKTGKVFTTVLGTQFNIDAYNPIYTSVFVAEGKVNVLFQNKVIATLIQNEKTLVSQQNGAVLNDEPKRLDLASWKDAIETYDNIPLSKLIERLENISGLKIQYPIELKNELINTTLYLNDIPKSLEILSQTLEADLQIKP
jgi:transmembrane sensor